ncbi:MAG: 4Fe-4S dicluster domain-containing protein [Planctomycetota bacterium]
MKAVTVKTVRSAGVVGAGGAGFPTHVKVSAEADTVLLNAAECEPLLHKDKQVLQHFADEVLAGFAAVRDMVGAERGIIGIKAKYSDVIDLLQSKLPEGIEIAPLQDAYPAGDEFILVYDVLGRVVPPGGIPLNVGAVVVNVETAMNVALSPQRPVTEKFVSVAGSVENPCTLRVPVGTPLSSCVSTAGGATVPDPHYIVGGVMMGRLTEDHDEPVLKTTGAVLVFGGEHTVTRRYARTDRQRDLIGKSACDQCTFCTELCPRYLLGHPIEPHKAMRSLEFNLVGEPDVIGTSFCCECNLCSMYSCPEDLDPKDVCAVNKRRLAAEGRKWTDPPFNPRRAEVHLNNRKAPMRRLITKLGLDGFHNVGPLLAESPQPASVKLPLSQHVGAPCQPGVKVGQKVSVGEPVAIPPEKGGKPALGAAIHASIDGKVTAVDESAVTIER